MTKSALDSLLLHFCLVRIRYIFLRVSLFLFYHCSRTIDCIVPLLFLTQLLRLSVLNVFLHNEKSVGWNSLGRNYIFHLCMTQGRLKKTNEQKNSSAFQEVLFSTIYFYNVVFEDVMCLLNNSLLLRRRFIT